MHERKGKCLQQCRDTNDDDDENVCFGSFVRYGEYNECIDGYDENRQHRIRYCSASTLGRFENSPCQDDDEDGCYCEHDILHYIQRDSVLDVLGMKVQKAYHSEFAQGEIVQHVSAGHHGDGQHVEYGDESFHSVSSKARIQLESRMRALSDRLRIRFCDEPDLIP